MILSIQSDHKTKASAKNWRSFLITLNMKINKVKYFKYKHKTKIKNNLIKI